MLVILIMTFYNKVFAVMCRSSIQDLTAILYTRTMQNSPNTFWSVLFFATSIFPATEVSDCIFSQELDSVCFYVLRHICAILLSICFSYRQILGQHFG